MELVTNIIYSLTSSFLYDVLKSFCRVKPKKEYVEGIVGDFIREYTDTELDSGSFNKFLNSYSTRLKFKQYIRYTSMKRVSHKLGVNQTIGRNTFIDDISYHAVQFIKLDIKKPVNVATVRRYFTHLLNIMEHELYNSLPEEFMAVPYILIKSLEQLQENLLEKINCSSEIESSNYTEAANTYIKILKKRFSKADVYGIKRNLDFYSFYIFPKLEVVTPSNGKSSPEDDFEKKKVIDWKDIFIASNIISIIGGAGYGKTLFLKNIVNSFDKLSFFEAENTIPIYCNLKEFSKFSRLRSRYSIEDYLLDSMTHYSGLDQETVNRRFLRSYLETGRCLILLDALDEVEVTERKDLCELILSFFSVANKNNKVCITTRDRGLIPDTPVVYRVLPITMEQIREYLDKMIELELFDDDERQLFLKRCHALVSDGFLTNFLILSLLINVYDAESELPVNKIELYEKCSNYIARKREIDDKEIKFDFDLMYSLLENEESFEKLAFLCRPNNSEVHKRRIEKVLKDTYKKRYSDENRLLKAINEFLRFCSTRTDLFVLGNRDEHYKFFHRSFFEYYYAKFVSKNYGTEDLISELMRFDYDSEIYELSAYIERNHIPGAIWLFWNMF